MPYAGIDPAETVTIKVEVLDAEAEHKKLIEYYRFWREQTQDGRQASMRDLRYYHGHQWTSVEVATLKGRGQAPTVINKIHRKVNFARGTEVRTRVDPKASPRTPGEEQGAAAMADAIRYVADAVGFNDQRGDLAEALLVPGLTGFVTEVKREGGEIKVCGRQVDYDRLWWDPRAKQNDFSDARYKGVVTWMDEDQMVEAYGAEAAEEVYGLATGEADDITHTDKPEEWIDTTNKRCLVLECYYLRDGVWWQAHFTFAGFLGEKGAPRPSPYLDDCVPPRPVSALDLMAAFVDDSADAAAPQHYGMVRHMISPQDEINKRRSKLLWLLQVHQMAYEDTALADVQAAKEQLAQPDGAVKLNHGALVDGRWRILDTGQQVAGQMQMLQVSMQEIDIVGANAEGLVGQAGLSGRSVMAQQNLANVEMEPVMTRLRQLQQRIFVQMWWRVRQFWTTEKWLRVRDDPNRTGYRFVGLNRRMTRGERLKELVGQDVPLESALEAVGLPMDQAQQLVQHGIQVMQANAQQQGVQLDPRQADKILLDSFLTIPEARDEFTANDVERIHVDIELDVAPDTAVLRQEQFETLANLAQAYPQSIPPEAVIEMSELRPEVKKSIRERIEAMRQPDPQGQQLAQAAQQVELQKQQAAAQRSAAAAQLDQAKAQKTAAEAALSVPAAAQRDQAAALSDAVKAGGSLPDFGA